MNIYYRAPHPLVPFDEGRLLAQRELTSNFARCWRRGGPWFVVTRRMPARYCSAPELAELDLGLVGTREQVLACLVLQRAQRAHTSRTPDSPASAPMPPTPPHRPKPPPTPPAQLAARIDAIIGTCAEVLAAIVLQAAVRLWRQRRRRAAAARALQRASRAYLRRSRPDVETRAVCAAAAARVMRSVLVRQAETIRAADARPSEDREATCAHSPSASSLSAASPSASLPGTGASILAARETVHSPGRTRAGVVIGRLGAAAAHPDDPAAVAAASAAAAAAASRATGGATGASSRCLGSNGGSSSCGGGGVDGGGGSSGGSGGRWCVRNLDTGIAINVTQLEELYDEIYSEMPMGCGGAATQAQAASGPREAGAGAAGAADVAGAAGPLLITGVLLKRGKKLGQWTPRWFQLAVSGELTCYLVHYPPYISLHLPISPLYLPGERRAHVLPPAGRRAPVPMPRRRRGGGLRPAAAARAAGAAG